MLGLGPSHCQYGNMQLVKIAVAAMQQSSFAWLITATFLTINLPNDLAKNSIPNHTS